MRTLRALTIAATVVALPSLATAQQGRPFKDAWFWGVKAGGFTVADTGGSNTLAPMVGAEWLITRTHGGLYISAGQAYANLNAVQGIASRQIRCPSATTDPISGDVPVGLSGLKVTGGSFNLNWSTDKSWAGTCRRLFIHLSDGTTPYADFQFK